MKQRDITPYNILKKIVPARKMMGKIARVKIKMVIMIMQILHDHARLCGNRYVLINI